MVESETKQVYVFCDKCKENVSLDITDEDIESSKTGLTTVLSVHGTPQHAILVYLDKNLKARGVEYPSVLQVKENTESVAEPALPDEDETHDLQSVISSFGESDDSATKSFAQIIAQVIAGNSLYLIHNNKSIGKVVKDQLESLFTEQKTSLTVISYDEIDTVYGMRPAIFDIRYGNFISEGVAIETDYFEQLVKDAIGSPNGFSLLKNEFSKLMFSYRRLWDLLTTGAKKYTRKRLAYLVSIDDSLMPLLLQMAENDGIDVASRVRLSEEDKKSRK